MKLPEHLDRIRLLPCLVCGDNTATEAAHVRYGDRSVGKILTGMGRKPPDWFCVPLCSRCHREQHCHGEFHWWAAKDIDAVKVALALFVYSHDPEHCEKIITYHSKGW